MLVLDVRRLQAVLSTRRSQMVHLYWILHAGSISKRSLIYLTVMQFSMKMNQNRFAIPHAGKSFKWKSHTMLPTLKLMSKNARYPPLPVLWQIFLKGSLHESKPKLSTNLLRFLVQAWAALITHASHYTSSERLPLVVDLRELTKSQRLCTIMYTSTVTTH